MKYVEIDTEEGSFFVLKSDVQIVGPLTEDDTDKKFTFDVFVKGRSIPLGYLKEDTFEHGDQSRRDLLADLEKVR